MVKALNLFGEMQEMQDGNEGTSPYIRFKNQYRYRETLDKLRSCKTCKNCVQISHRSKFYYKCKLIGVSNSEATDIRLKNVCDKWIKDDGRG